MPLGSGTRIGPYEIQSALGAGGMGEVYRARDTKLGRDVALKILPDTFAHDPERRARFQREAQVLASLNHPHIGAIYGLEESDGESALVLELVEGPTLADRIAQGPLPVDEALPIARQIAEALEAAYEQGIVHRDLKPANIKITPAGDVKVLDFGLAKAMAPASAVSADLTASPTMMNPMMTGIGVILGTAPYMSPEQAKGQAVGKRSDVWAFGCVLYEMLTGERAFSGNTVSEVVSEVLKSQPDWSRLPAETPESLRRLLRRLLQKDEKQRLHDMADVRIELDDVGADSAADASVARSVVRRERIVWASAVALVVLAGSATIAWNRWSQPAPVRASEMRLEITTPPTADPVSLAISPDGSKLVYVGASDGRSMLWLRSLASVASRPLERTEGASYPFWSPDSRSVGFFADGKLKRIDVDGGSLQTLADALPGRGGTWSRSDVILFAPTGSGAIFRVSALGGEPVQVTKLQAPQQESHRTPMFLPDGRHFLYYVRGGRDVRGVYVGQLDEPGSNARRLFEADSHAEFASSGYLLFVRMRTLFAQPFDPVRLELSGKPVVVAENVAFDVTGDLAAVSTSSTGSIVYRSGSGNGWRQLIWFDRSGNEIASVGDPDNNNLMNPSLSSDGAMVAAEREVDGNGDIWLIDTRRDVVSRFTFDPLHEVHPVWSPDGRSIVFGSDRNGVYDLYRRSINAGGSETLLLRSSETKNITDWSSDGRFILYRNTSPKTSYDIWALPLDGGKPFPVVQTSFEERDGQFSPDGKWIAYQSNKSGRFEIYVQPFLGAGTEVQVSTGGGTQARWRRDGRELYYVAPEDRLISVPIAVGGRTIEPGRAVPLFARRLARALGSFSQEYMVSPDGQRFLMNVVVEGSSVSPITVVLNWDPK